MQEGSPVKIGASWMRRVRACLFSCPKHPVVWIFELISNILFLLSDHIALKIHSLCFKERIRLVLSTSYTYTPFNTRPLYRSFNHFAPLLTTANSHSDNRNQDKDKKRIFRTSIPRRSIPFVLWTIAQPCTLPFSSLFFHSWQPPTEVHPAICPTARFLNSKFAMVSLLVAIKSSETLAFPHRCSFWVSFFSCCADLTNTDGFDIYQGLRRLHTFSTVSRFTIHCVTLP